MKVLAIGAHHDDIEIGCGGTLARLADQGHATFGLTLTNSETHYDLRDIHRTRETALAEATAAAAVIGLRRIDIAGEDRDNGALEYDVHLMRRIEDIISEHDISMVLTHWDRDLNTDHAAAARMSIVAARHVPCVLMYRSNWYAPNGAFDGSFFVDISDYIDRKRACLSCFESEIENRGRAWIETFIDGHRIAGFSHDRRFAELFEPIKFELFRF